MKALRLPLLLFAFAAVCGLHRWIDTFRTIPSRQINLLHLNQVHWDDIGKRISPAGNDPYVIIDIPPDATPIRSITIFFNGHYVETEGTFYLLPSSGDAIIARVRKAPGTFSVSGKLDNVTGLRLDLPDFLPRSVQFDRILIRKPFIDWSSPSFRLATFSFAAGLLALIFSLRRRRVAAREFSSPCQNAGR